MDATRGKGDTLREPLDAAIEVETRLLRIRIDQVWQALCALGLIVSAVAAALVSRPLGLWGAMAAASYLVWFTVHVRLLRRGRGGRAFELVSTLIESAIPWVFFAVIYATRGSVHALGSWVPPLLVGALLIASTARLRPIAPLIIGVSAGIAFPALYFVLLRGSVPAELASEPLFQGPMQLTRGLSLAVGGALTMLVARALRKVIARADSTVRERELFGKYRLIRVIAAGGMGTVHEALYCPEGGFERRVAVKCIHPHLARQSRFVDAFRVEAELSARLVHSNIVQVLDLGREGESYFLAMEYVEGITLQSFMRRLRAAGIPIAPSLVADLGAQILAGLDYSHNLARSFNGSPLRVVHRDLCPANVLLSNGGDAKITDFGIARALGDAEVVQTTTVAGHAGYMAPEQARALPIDARCDLFSLGVILWELLCGTRLFYRGSEGPTLLATLTEEVPPPTTLRTDVDPSWDVFLLRATERDVGKRFQRADEMVTALMALPGAGAGDSRASLASLVARALELPEPKSDGGEPTWTDQPTSVA